MSVIKRLVYDCGYSPSGEETLRVGEFIADIGQVSSIMLTDTGAAMVRVEGNLLWMVIPAHKICRWFFI